jgi:hypothetical protein
MIPHAPERLIIASLIYFVAAIQAVSHDLQQQAWLRWPLHNVEEITITAQRRAANL